MFGSFQLRCLIHSNGIKLSVRKNICSHNTPRRKLSHNSPIRCFSVWLKWKSFSALVKPTFASRHYSQDFAASAHQKGVRGEGGGISVNAVGQVFVVQPFEAEDVSKNVHLSSPNITSPELELNESIALVETMPDWRVCGHATLKLQGKHSHAVFSKKNLEVFKKCIDDVSGVNTLFISVETLSNVQKQYLKEVSGMEYIFDRYTLVLQIFKLRAKTKEAKLQVALAEIPVKKATLKTHQDTSQNPLENHLGKGSGESYTELLRREFSAKEQRLMERLKHVKRIRDEHREGRKRNAVPIVAVIGYTNAGKTSLIKALSILTERVQPKDYLFATLDVTAHAAILPNNLRYVLIDTVGFLSKLPHSLIDAFNATMEDMLQADLLIHVRDISHPDTKNQLRNVLKVLSNLNLPTPLLNNIIEVRNKVDLIKPSSDTVFDELARKKEEKYPDVIVPTARTPTPGTRSIRPAVICHVSATAGTGLPSLVQQIQQHVMRATRRNVVTVKVPAVGNHVTWLKEHCAVQEIAGSGDFDLKLTIIAADWQLAKFTNCFKDAEVLNRKFKQTEQF